MAAPSGSVDFRDEQFVVTCTFDGRAHAELRGLPQVEYEQGVWRIPLHRKSVAGLMAIARRREWPLSRSAERARTQVQEAVDQAEYYLQVVQGPAGEPILKCRADDPELESALDAIPGTERDDGPSTWLFFPTRAEACDQLRALVERDSRFDVDPAAERLLRDPDDWPELSAVSVREPAAEQPVGSPAPAALPRPPELSVGDATAAFEREQELLAWSRAVICEADASALDSRLRPYQRAGVRYLRTARRALLADDKALGKCAQALVAIEAEAAYPALILCARPLELQWQHEIASFLGETRSWAVVENAPGSIADADIVIADYELIYRRREELKARRFRSIVADDSMTLRNERTLKTRAALEIAATVDELRFCLSDTALFEQPIHLLPQLEFLGRIDELHGRNAFVERYCRPHYDVSGTRYGATNIEELEQRLRACCLCARTFAQVAPQLPSLSRYRHAIGTARSASARDAELELIAELRELRLSARDADDEHERAERKGAQRERVERLRLIAGRAKVESTSEWIDHFLTSGAPLAVIVVHPEIAALYERKYPEAVFVRADGACVRAGSLVSPFFVTDAELVFFQRDASGPAIRLARGRCVVHAELSATTSSLALTRLLMESKTREQSVAAWDLVSEAIADRALDALLSQHRAEQAALREDDFEQLLEALVERDLASEPELSDAAEPTTHLG